MKFSTWLKNLRLNKGLTQREFGAVLDLSYVSICHFETGLAKPSIKSITKLSAYSGVNVKTIRNMIKEA